MIPTVRPAMRSLMRSDLMLYFRMIRKKGKMVWQVFFTFSLLQLNAWLTLSFTVSKRGGCGSGDCTYHAKSRVPCKESHVPCKESRVPCKESSAMQRVT